MNRNGYLFVLVFGCRKREGEYFLAGKTKAKNSDYNLLGELQNISSSKGKDLSGTIMFYEQGALNANSRFIIESWKSPLSNAENPGDAKNGAKPKKPEQTQLRETRDPAEESWAKLALSAEAKLFFQP